MSNVNIGVVIREYVRYIIEHSFKEDLENFEISLVRATKQGENWLGMVYSTKIEIFRRNKNNVTLNLITKIAPQQTIFRIVFPVRNIYSREMYVYNNILPEFIKLQQEKNFNNIFQPFAQAFFTTMNQGREAIILKDMKEDGFKIGDYNHVINYEQALLLMKELGRFHALSFAMKDQKPDIFKNWEANCKDCFFNGSLHNALLRIVTILSKKIPENKHLVNSKYLEMFETSVKNNLPNVFKDLLNIEQFGNYVVINHGDYHTGNILFKYGNPAQPNAPTELCMLDWQMTRLGSPSSDILYFMFLCTDKEFRRLYHTTLIRDYYSSFSSFLRMLGSDPDVLFPVKVLAEHIKKFAVFPFYTTVWLIALDLLKVENRSSLYHALNEDAVVEYLSTLSKASTNKFVYAVSDVISDFITYGYEF